MVKYDDLLWLNRMDWFKSIREAYQIHISIKNDFKLILFFAKYIL